MAEEEEQKMDFAAALAQVLKDARANDCLARGLREVCKAVESQKAAFVIMAESCDDDKYKKCIEALCIDCSVNRVKVVKCSSCAVLNTIPDSVTNSAAFKMVADSMK